MKRLDLADLGIRPDPIPAIPKQSPETLAVDAAMKRAQAAVTRLVRTVEAMERQMRLEILARATTDTSRDVLLRIERTMLIVGVIIVAWMLLK